MCCGSPPSVSQPLVDELTCGSLPKFVASKAASKLDEVFSKEVNPFFVRWVLSVFLFTGFFRTRRQSLKPHLRKKASQTTFFLNR